MRDLPVPDVPTLAQAAPHGASLGAIVASFMGWLPAVIAIIPAVYYLILIYESKTIQDLMARRRTRKAAKAVAKAQAAVIVADAAVVVAKDEAKKL